MLAWKRDLRKLGQKKITQWKRLSYRGDEGGCSKSSLSSLRDVQRKILPQRARVGKKVKQMNKKMLR